MANSRSLPAQTEEILANTCDTKRLKEVILDSDDEQRCEKYIRLTEDNIDDIQHKLGFTFKNYAIVRKDSLDVLTEDVDYVKGRLVRDAEGVMRDKNELKYLKKLAKSSLLKKLKAEMRRRRKIERQNKLFTSPKWWMYLMKSGEKILMKRKKGKSGKLLESAWKTWTEWKTLDEKPAKGTVNVNEFLDKRSKRRQMKREDRAQLCTDFWSILERERRDLMKMMLGVQLKKFMIRNKKEKERKLMGNAPKQTIPVILINLSYLQLKQQKNGSYVSLFAKFESQLLKRKQCIRLMKKNFNNIIGATEDEVKLLKNKLNEVKHLFKKRNSSNKEHLILLMNLSKKVFVTSKNKNSIKEDLINYYIDGIYSMMDVHKKVAQDINVSTIRNPKIYNKAYKIMNETETFISEQIRIFKYLRNVLLHAEWTYLYYARMRVIKKLDEAIKKIMCAGYVLKIEPTEGLVGSESDYCNEVICEEPEYIGQYLKDNPTLGRMVHTKDFCPISNHSIF